jgi:YD repeat-containing protein
VASVFRAFAYSFRRNPYGVFVESLRLFLRGGQDVRNYPFDISPSRFPIVPAASRAGRSLSLCDCARDPRYAGRIQADGHPSSYAPLREKSGWNSGFTNTYDEENRLIGISASGGVSTYTYDALDRLTKDNTTGTNAHVYDYTFDAASNRTASSETGVNITWTYDLAGRLVTSLETSNLTTYTYDANGNLTNIQPPASGPAPTAMTYDQENRLVRHQVRSVVNTMTYDGDGFKRAEISATGTTTLIWDGSDYLQGRS